MRETWTWMSSKMLNTRTKKEVEEMVRTMLDVVSGHMGLFMSIFNVHSETLTKFLLGSLNYLTEKSFFRKMFGVLQYLLQFLTNLWQYSWHLLHQPHISHVSHTTLALFHLETLPPLTTIVHTDWTLWVFTSRWPDSRFGCGCRYIFVCSPFSQ